MTRPGRLDLQREFAAVRGVLLTEWNPVGTDCLPDDEYDAYVWPIVRMLREGTDAETLARHLQEVELKWFANEIKVELLKPVAQALLALNIGRGTN